MTTQVTIMDVMRFCDGALSADEMRRVAAEIDGDPELQSIARDLRDGAAATRAALAAVGEAPMPLHLTRAILRRPPAAPAGMRPVAWRYAATLLLGAVFGAGAIAVLDKTDGSGLRLAGAPATNSDPTQSAEFLAALTGALRGHVPDQTQSYRNGAVAGSVTVKNWFVLDGGSDCAAFTHNLQSGTGPQAFQGLACNDPNGGWEILQMPAGK